MLAVIVRLAFRILIVGLWLRAIFVFFAIASSSTFVSWIYTVTGPLIRPFAGIAPNYVLLGKFTLEAATLIAIVAYALIEFILVGALRAGKDY